MARQTIILHSESEFVTMTNRSHFKHITSLKRNSKLNQRALTLSYDEETTLLTNNLSIIFFLHDTLLSNHCNQQTYSRSNVASHGSGYEQRKGFETE